MAKLWLNFCDEKGNPQRVEVDQDKFSIGRHSDNNLKINQSSLSRFHLKIERFGEIFVASDLGSSNGTTINGKKLTEPVALKNGDEINCGGGFVIKVELESAYDELNENQSSNKSSQSSSDNESQQAGQAQQENQPQHITSSAQTNAQQAFPISLFVLAPLLGLIVLVFVGAFIFLFVGERKQDDRRTSTTNRETKFVKSRDEDESGVSRTDTKSNSYSTETNTNSNSQVIDDTKTTDSSSEPSLEPDETAKVERNAIVFARQLALHDTNYVFTQKQIEEIRQYVKKLAASSAIATGLRELKKNKSQIAQLAESKGLKPQLLAIASLATLEKQKEASVLVNAQKILPVLNDLKISLGNELTDDNLLIIAAFDQGMSGKTGAMRNMLEALGREPGVDARKVRTVWFLRERGKISNEQYDLVLRFLAIGTISQSPKDFGVQAEPLIF